MSFRRLAVALGSSVAWGLVFLVELILSGVGMRLRMRFVPRAPEHPTLEDFSGQRFVNAPLDMAGYQEHVQSVLWG